MKTKKCSICKLYKKISEFPKNKSRKDGLHYVCRVCHANDYIQKPDKHRNNHLKRTYGITLEDYNQMFDEQQGCCAICGIHQSKLKKVLFVDHNHLTKKIRQLLCNDCNLLLSNSKENVEILESAIEYLKEYNE